MDERTGPDGRTLHVDREDGDTGTKGPFYVAYVDAERERRWGYFCGHCETFNNAMDSMGRIRCNDCSNLRKAEEWDAVHE
jgi:hypothetical protein